MMKKKKKTGLDKLIDEITKKDVKKAIKIRQKEDHIKYKKKFKWF